MLKQVGKAAFVSGFGRLPMIGVWFDKLSCWAQFSCWCVERGCVAEKYRPLCICSYDNRYELYESVVKQEALDTEGIDYLEFGVYRGESIAWWCKRIATSNARFIGFDTFTGLP